MAQNLPTPPALPCPFAANGDKNTIPLLYPGEGGNASYDIGFPPKTSEPISAGDIPPSREDMNGVLNAATFPQYFLQMGGYYTFDENIASAIGGYPYGAILTYYDSANRAVRKLRSLYANNNYNFVTSPGYIGTYWEDVTAAVYTGLPLFATFYALSTETPYGAVPLDGRTLAKSDYPDFYEEAVARATAGTIATKTAAHYAEDLSAHGQCNAFVINTTAQTVRIPTITAFVQNGTLGTIHDAGLPNISANITLMHMGRFATSPSVATGAFSIESNNQGFGVDNGQLYGRVQGLNLNASRSNPIYGNANTVQPKSVEMVLFIQVIKGNAYGSGGYTEADIEAIARRVVSSGGHSVTSENIYLGGLTINDHLTETGPAAMVDMAIVSGNTYTQIFQNNYYSGGVLSHEILSSDTFYDLPKLSATTTLRDSGGTAIPVASSGTLAFELTSCIYADGVAFEPGYMWSAGINFQGESGGLFRDANGNYTGSAVIFDAAETVPTTQTIAANSNGSYEVYSAFTLNGMFQPELISARINDDNSVDVWHAGLGTMTSSGYVPLSSGWVGHAKCWTIGTSGSFVFSKPPTSTATSEYKWVMSGYISRLETSAPNQNKHKLHVNSGDTILEATSDCKVSRGTVAVTQNATVSVPANGGIVISASETSGGITRQTKMHVSGGGVFINGSALTPGGGGSGGITSADVLNILSSGGYQQALVSVTDSSTTSVAIPVLSGGTSYKYTSALTGLTITSAVPGCRAQFKFQAGADSPTFNFLIPASCDFTGSSSFTSGTYYRLAIDGEDAVVVEYTPGV